MKITQSAKVAILGASVLMSCQTDRLAETPAGENYVREFIKEFGLAHPSQDWNFGRRVTAEIYPDQSSGGETLSVYSEKPGNPGAALVARFSASTRTFEFDYPREADQAYVEVRSPQGTLIRSGYWPVKEGVLRVGTPVSRAEEAGDNPNVQLVDLLDHPAFGSVYVSTVNESSLKSAGYTIKDYPADVNDENVYKRVLYDSTDGMKLTWNDQIFINRFQLTLAREKFRVELLVKDLDQVKAVIMKELNGYNWDASTLKTFGNWDSSIESTSDGYKKLVFDSDDIEISLDDPVRMMKRYGICFMGPAIVYKVTVYYPGAKELLFKDVFEGGLYGITNPGVKAASREEFMKEGVYYKPDFDKNLGKVANLAQIVGTGGMFADGVHDNGAGGLICNLEKYRNVLHPDEDITFDVTEDDMEISLNYFFGTTVHYNSIGYFYWTGDLTPEEILKRPKYIMAFNATPGMNMKVDNNGDGNFQEFTTLGMASPKNGEVSDSETLHMTLINKVNDPDDKSIIDGTTYKLMYFGEDGKGSTQSYKFPKGTHIAFFNITGGYYRLKTGDTGMEKDNPRLMMDANSIAFSMPSLNKLIGNLRYKGHGHDTKNYDGYRYGTGEAVGSPAFAAYKWTGNMILAVEDCPIASDDDMNDMLFQINGVVNKTVTEVKEDPKAEIQSWIVAAEDLGTTYDYDFNDVVVGVSHFATDKEEDKAIYFTGLASGGVLPVKLVFKDREIGGEFHSWFGSEPGNVINAGKYERRGQVWKVPYTGTFSLSDDHAVRGKNGLRDLRLLVDNGSGYQDIRETEEANNLAPEFIIFKNTWHHPTEGTHITIAYPSFKDWIGFDPAQATTEAYKQAYDKVVNGMNNAEGPVVKHGWKGHDPETISEVKTTDFTLNFSE